MVKTASILFPVALFLCVSSAHGESQNEPGTVLLDEVTNFIYQTQRDARRAETRLAPIRSLSDLSEYLSKHPSTPFDAFSKRALGLFIESLTFNELGLTGFRTAEVESDLTPRQAFAILSLFGVQKTISSLQFEHSTDEDKELLQRIGDVIRDDYPEYKCIGRATCRSSPLNICIGGNCTWTP